MNQRTLCISIILCLVFSSFLSVHAADDWFYIEEIKADGTTRVIDKVQSYTVAKATYDAHEANTYNIQIRHGEDVWKMKYGIVLFHTSETCDYNVTYKSAIGNGYTNGCYGIDAAYLGSDENDFQNFYLSGIHGSTSGDDVDLQPIETAANVSQYQVRDGYLYHQIKTDRNHNVYGADIFLGKAPDYLSDDHSYYSYDGHYFYSIGENSEGFHQMIDDLKDGNFIHSINAGQPFYQYFQYLSHRSTTQYSAAEMEQYFHDQLHINSSLTTYRSIGISQNAILTQSLLKDSGDSFLFYQDRYGANAMMMLSLAMNESALGRSYLAYTRNNLFGHAAFDSAVEENASRYQSASASIRSHALHYINEGYGDPDSFSWNGAYFGNKAGGMNVAYASDPYWGEKAAQYYERVDIAMGEKDKNAQALGVLIKPNINIYEKPDTDSNVLYTNGNRSDFPVLILEDNGEWYQIQSDKALASGDGYDFTKSVGYVAKADVKPVNGAIPAPKQQRYAITFDAGNGHFDSGESTLTLKLSKDQMPAVPTPIQSGSLFIGWDHELEPVSQATTYTAKYESITSVKWKTLPQQTYQKEQELDVSDGMITITDAHGETQDIALNTSMVSGYDSQKCGSQKLTVNYQGASITYQVEVKENTSPLTADQQTRLNNLLKREWSEELTAETKAEVLDLKKILDEQGMPDLSTDDLRRLDAYIQKAYGSALQIRIADGGQDISASGLSSAIALEEPAFFPQILRLTWIKDIPRQKETLLTQVAEGNGYDLEYCFSLNGGKDMKDAPLQSEIIISFPKPDDHPDNYHYLILRYEDGQVIQEPVYQSENRITFSTDTFGDYALIYRPGGIVNAGEDMLENNSAATNPPSLLEYILWIIAALIVLFLMVITCIIRRRRKKAYQSKDDHQESTRNPYPSPTPPYNDSEFYG